MKQRFIIIILIGLFFPTRGQNPPQDKNWEVVFIDSCDSFNTSLWYKLYGAHEAGTSSEGAAFKTYDNIYYENGKLVVRTQKQQSPPCVPQCKYGGYHAYTTGGIASNNRYGYGYFEIYAQLPASSGHFPAFWLWFGEEDWATNNCWDNEIDIFEAMGSRPNYVESNAWCSYRCRTDYAEELGRMMHPCNYSTGYHWYAVEWNSDKITWYVDRKAVRQITNNMYTIGIQNPMQIFINSDIAIGGDNSVNSTTIFPNFMYVDKIGVYQLKYDCQTVINEITNYNEPHYNYAVKKSITLSGISSLDSLENVSLRATDFIELKSGFEVPEGAELYLDINPCDQ
jgi:beta-glucanase (GH16 family)